MIGHASAPPSAGRSRVGLLVALALTFVFFQSVHRFLSPPEIGGEAGQIVPQATTRKLFLFVVDGLRPEDAADPRLTFLEPYRTHGFSAEVEPCLECLTIPCISEALTGTTTTGLLGAYYNLVSGGDPHASSLFADVITSGRRTAVVDQKEYRGFSDALTRQYHGKNEWKTVKGYVKAGIDFIVWHYGDLDDVGHHHKVGTKGYNKGLDRLDAAARTLVATLPPAYRLVIAGDHGHTSTGRHVFGLDVPTTFLSDGATFGSAPVAGRLPISTYRYLLGAELGILPPDRYDGANLADRLPPGSALRAAAKARVYVGPDRPAPGWVACAALLLGALAVWAAPGSLRGWVALGIALAVSRGWTYLSALPIVHNAGTTLPHVREWMVGPLFVAGAIGWLFRRDARPLLLILLLAAMALPATLYEYGFFQALPYSLFGVTLLLTLPRLWKADEPIVGRWLLPLLALTGAWYLMNKVGVINFAITGFPRLKALPTWAVPLAWASLSAAMARGWKWRLLAGTLAGLGASGLVDVNGYPLAFLTAAILVSAIRFPAALPTLSAWAALPWYGRSSTGVVCCVVFAVAACRLAWGDPRLRQWFVPVVTTAIAWYSLAYTAGLRSNGLDFDFAIHWFPGDLHFRFWPVIALATLVKVLLAPVLVVLGVQRFCGPVDRRAIAPMVYIRLAGIAAGLAGLLVRSASPPRYWVIEQVEDMVAWLLVLGVVLVATWRDLDRRRVGAGGRGSA